MPIKIEYKTEQEVKDLPITGLISYTEIIDETYRLIEQKGLKVKKTIYKPNSNGDTVTSIFILEDIEELNLNGLNPCISWTHSYHKAIRFSCNSSCIDMNDDILIISGNKSEPSKRRASDIDKYRVEIFEDLELEISLCNDAFKTIVEFRDTIEKRPSNISTASISLGMLYLEEDLLTTSQISIVKDYIKYNPLKTGLDMYKAFGEALKESHPKLFLQNYINLYNFFKEVFIENKEEINKKVEVKSEVNREILEKYDYISSIPSVVFL